MTRHVRGSTYQSHFRVLIIVRLALCFRDVQFVFLRYSVKQIANPYHIPPNTCRYNPSTIILFYHTTFSTLTLFNPLRRLIDTKTKELRSLMSVFVLHVLPTFKHD